MYSTPELSFVPPAEIAGAVTASIHVPDPDTFAAPEQAALAARGRYLFTVTSRAFCHGIDGGGVLHWQGMVWDHLSNLDEEDVRALIFFLRALPAIAREIPAAQAPGPDDCKEYTFFLYATDKPGCE